MSIPARINPSVTKIGKRKWRLNSRFINVPARFETDGARVPRLLWAFLDPAGEAFESAIVHDYNITIDKSKFKMNSHKVFKDMLIQYDVRIWKAYIAYWFVCAYWLLKGLIK